MTSLLYNNDSVSNLVQECFSAGSFNADHFKSKISSQTPIPLTRRNLDAGLLRSGSLVEYRGMVQDMFDPEIFCLTYRSRDRQCCGLFQDFLPTMDEFDPMANGAEGLAEREVVYLVPVPGEMEWARKTALVEASVSNISPNPKAAVRETKKRERDENGMESEQVENGGNEDVPMERDEYHGKRNKEVVEIPKKAPVQLQENHPIPFEKEIPCMAKLYEPIVKYTAHRRYQLHDVVKVVGILSLEFDESRRDASEEMDLGVETRDCIPSSVAPRVHVIDIHIDESPMMTMPLATPLEQVRSGCLRFLTQSLQGDALAAEMVLLWMVSGTIPIASAEDAPLVGKLSLGLTKVSNSAQLKSALSQLLPRCQFVDPDEIVKHRFIPRKNMDLNRLEAGRLQVAHGTRLVIDETTLTPRTLDEQALKNIQALNRLAEYQKFEYDFQFYTRDQNCDQPVLVLSPGAAKPVLISAVDCILPIESSSTTSSGEDLVQMIPSEVMDSFRTFVELSRQRSKTLDLVEETIRAVESDFVSARNIEQQRPGDGKDRISEKDLHMWLNLARFTAATMGREAVTIQDYGRARMIDSERRKRLAVVMNHIGSGPKQ